MTRPAYVDLAQVADLVTDALALLDIEADAGNPSARVWRAALALRGARKLLDTPTVHRPPSTVMAPRMTVARRVALALVPGDLAAVAGCTQRAMMALERLPGDPAGTAMALVELHAARALLAGD